MNYSSEQLPNGRWGIYQQGKLLATIGCYQTCAKILNLLQLRESNKSNKPQDLSSLQAETLKSVETSDFKASKTQTAA